MQNSNTQPMTRNSMLCANLSSIGVTVCLQVINSQHRSCYSRVPKQQYQNKWHAKWVSYLQQNGLSLKHKSGIPNKWPMDWVNKPTFGINEVYGDWVQFKFKNHYHGDAYFTKIMHSLQNWQQVTYPHFILKDWFLFKVLRLCVPQCSSREQILIEQT